MARDKLASVKSKANQIYKFFILFNSSSNMSRIFDVNLQRSATPLHTVAQKT